MKLKTVLLYVLIAALAMVGLPASAQMIGGESDIAMIKTVWDNYAAYVESGDGALWLAQYDVYGIQMRPDAQPRSKAELDAQVPAAFAARVQANEVKMVIIPLEIVVAGDWAFSRGEYTQHFTAKASGKTSLVDGKFLTIFRKNADNTWKIYRDCFNSNVPPK